MNGKLLVPVAEWPAPWHLLNRRSAAGLVVSVVALALAIRGVRTVDVLAAVAQADLMFVVAATATALGATVVSTLRWRFLLWPHRLPLAPLTAVFFVSQLCNAVLPGKPGALLRAVLGSRLARIPLAFTVGSVAIERVLDSALIALLSTVLLAVLPVPQAVASIGREVALLTSAILLLIVSLAIVKPLLVARLTPLAQGMHILRALQTGLDSLDVLRQPCIYGALLSLSGLVWLLGIATNDLVLHAMRLNTPWWTPALLLIALQLGGKLPSSPANVGIFHYIAVLVLTEAGVTSSTAFAYAAVLHIVVFIIPAIVGALCVWLLSVGRSDCTL